MLAVDYITGPTLVIVALAFVVSLGFTSARWSLLSLFLIALGFLLYRQVAVYGSGPADGDYDFGFPFRWITTQNDSGPYRLRWWALAADFAVGAAVWRISQLVFRSARSRTA